MRADRLVATLLLIQAARAGRRGRARRGARGVGGHARRDLEALSTAGIPVYPQAGRGGGWSLLGGARTDLSGLTAPEAQALFVLVGPAAAIAPEAKAALRKLVRALPDTFRADAEAAARRSSSTRRGGADREHGPRWSPRCSRPSSGGGRSASSTAGGRGQHSERLIYPWGLVDKDDVWYLVAGTEPGSGPSGSTGWSRRRSPTSCRTPGPTTSTWPRRGGGRRRGRAPPLAVSATVLIDRRFVPVLRSQFGRHAEVTGEHDDGRARVRVSAPTPLTIAQHLAGWGARSSTSSTRRGALRAGPHRCRARRPLRVIGRAVWPNQRPIIRPRGRLSNVQCGGGQA